MVQSDIVTVLVEGTSEKVAEVDVDFIRLPLSTEDELKNGVVDVCNDAFASQGETRLTAMNPRLSQINWSCWRGTVDVIGYEEPQGYTQRPPVQGFFLLSSAFWLAVIIWIAGAVIGYLIGKWILYRVQVRPLELALQEVVNDIDGIIAKKHADLAAGYISQEVADELDAMLEETRDKAEDAGDDPQYDWVDYLEKISELGKYIPWIIGGAVALAVIGAVKSFAPRRY